MPLYHLVSRFSSVCLLQALLFCLWATCLPAQEQLQIGKHYSVTEGLSERTLWDIKKDSLGYLWLGTNHGLCRFDGMHFLNISASLPVTPLKRIEVLDDRRLLLVFGPGIRRFAIFNVHTFLPEYFDIPAGDADITKDPQGQVWVLSKGQHHFNIYQPGANSRLQLRYSIQRSPTDVKEGEHSCLLVLRDGRHLLYDGAGTFWLNDGKGATVRRIPGIAPTGCTFLHQDREGTIWTAFRDVPGVYQVVPDGLRLRRSALLPQSALYLRIWEDLQGNLIFGEKDTRANYLHRLYALRFGQKQVEALDKIIATEPRITGIMGDNFFNYLFMTSFVGLIKLHLAQPGIQHIGFLQDIKKGNFGNIIRAITTGGDGKIYFSREAGNWFVYDPGTKQMQTLYMKDARTGQVWHPTLCMGMYTDKRGLVWGYHAYEDDRQRGSLLTYDPFLKKTHSFPCPVPGVVYCFQPSADSTGLWLAFKQAESNMAIGYFRFSDHTFTQHHLKWKPASFWKGFIPYNMRVLHADTLLLATNKGILNINPGKGTIQSLLGPEQRDTLNEGIPVMAMERLDSERWLLGTEGRGLLVYNTRKQLTEAAYHTGNGLPNNDVCSIQKDNSGRFWLGTFHGLSCFDPVSRGFQHFFTADGLPDNEMNRRAKYKDKSGLLYFGTMNGLTFFDPERVLRKRQSRADGKIVLTALSYFDHHTNKIIMAQSGIDTLQQVTLPAGERFLSLSVALTDHHTPEQHHFEYRVDNWPIHAAWTPMDNQELHFDYLPPGVYTLHLRAHNHYGALTRDEKRIELVVQEYFYKQPWFFACCMAFLVLATYILYRFRLEHLLRIERLRTLIASDLHDEVGGLLSGVAMQADLLEDQVDTRLQPIVQRIAYSCRNAAASLRDVVWAIDARQDTAADLLLRMQDFAARTLALANIETIWTAPHFGEKDVIESQKRHHIYLIYKELVTNCLRHSKATRVNIELEKQRNTLYLRFRDNGQGFDPALIHSGMGLSNIRMRAEKIGATLRFRHEQGFAVELQIPL